MKISFSIVTYKNNFDDIAKVVRSLLLYPGEKIIYIADNSPTTELAKTAELDPCVSYTQMEHNMGFGRAHNWAIQQAEREGSKYHFVVNPDIFYTEDVAGPMVRYMEEHPDVGGMMPKLVYPNGATQYLPKLLPTPKMLLQRRVRMLLPRLHERWMRTFEMRPMRDDTIYEIGHISGSFALYRMETLQQCNGFDPRYFMYFEDTDLSRRINTMCRTLYFPMVSVYHEYQKGATKNLRLFLIFLSSLIKYFNRWGWIFDKHRQQRNKKFLQQLENLQD